MLNNPFPVWRVEISETVYEKEWDWIGSEENERDIRKYTGIKYLTQRTENGEWVEEYGETAGSFLYAFSRAAVTLVKLQEEAWTYEYFREDRVAAFIYEGKVYTNLFWIDDQKCICGTEEKYPDSEGVKIDVLYHSHLQLLMKKELHIINDIMYYDGKRIYTLEEFCSMTGLDPFNDIELLSTSFTQTIKQLYPDIKSISTDLGGTYFRENQEKGGTRDSTILKESKDPKEYIVYTFDKDESVP